MTEFRRVLFRSDRKSTRLNSSHTIISYAVFCLKKKKYDGMTCRSSAAPPPTDAGPAPRQGGACAVSRRAHVGLVPDALGVVARRCFFFLRTGRPRGSPLFPSRPPSG